MVPLVHSVPARGVDGGCSTGGRLGPPRLRHAVLGYAGSRAGGGAVRHRLLPLGCATLIVDLADPGRGGVVTGARDTATDDGLTTWGTVVSVGLTPGGVRGLLGVPMGELAGAAVRLSDVLGGRAGELAERLAAAPGWASRFVLLEEMLAGWVGTAELPSGVTRAWWRLQRPDPPAVGELAAELGTGRRRLERDFRREVGLAPGAVARVARFQRAVRRLSRGEPLAGVAASSGYAHQSHLTRETRAMAGVTPGELRAVVRHRPLVPAGR